MAAGLEGSRLRATPAPVMSEILLTGATGLLGRELALRLARRGDVVHLLVRREGRRAARTWISDLRLGDGPTAGRLRLLGGDLAAAGVVEARSHRAVENVEVVVHCAAAVDPRGDRAFAWKHNVRGTDAMLTLAAGLPKLRRFVHVSDVAVSGDRPGPFGEAELLAFQRFDGPYGEAKMVAERHVRTSALPCTVVRPSVLVGTERPARPRAVDEALARLVRRSELGRAAGLLPVPAAGTGRVDVVPAGWVADAIVALTDLPEAEGATVHLNDPDAPTMAGFVRAAAVALGRVPMPLPISAPRWLKAISTPAIYEPTSATRLLRPLGLEAPRLGDWLPDALRVRRD